MTTRQAVAFVKRHGVVLESAAGPVPSLVEAVVGESIRGSWWAHARGREIFSATRAVRDSGDVLVCRIVGGKITFVHRRLWPSLVRLSKRFPVQRLAQIREEHTESGRHIAPEVSFPKWVPSDISKQAERLSEAQAVELLGPWCVSRR